MLVSENSMFPVSLIIDIESIYQVIEACAVIYDMEKKKSPHPQVDFLDCFGVAWHLGDIVTLSRCVCVQDCVTRSKGHYAYELLKVRAATTEMLQYKDFVLIFHL